MATRSWRLPRACGIFTGNALDLPILLCIRLASSWCSAHVCVLSTGARASRGDDRYSRSSCPRVVIRRSGRREGVVILPPARGAHRRTSTSRHTGVVCLARAAESRTVARPRLRICHLSLDASRSLVVWRLRTCSQDLDQSPKPAGVPRSPMHVGGRYPGDVLWHEARQAPARRAMNGSLAAGDPLRARRPRQPHGLRGPRWWWDNLKESLSRGLPRLWRQYSVEKRLFRSVLYLSLTKPHPPRSRAPRCVNPSTGPRPRAWLEVGRPAS